MPIYIENLSHVYMQNSNQEKTAVKNINMTIEDGEFLGIIGHTGSGKSTLIQHMNGLLQPSSGRIVVNGMDLRDKKVRKAARKAVGMVFQYPEYQLFEETIAKDIAFGPTNVDIPKEEIDMRVRDAMEKVGLDYEKYAERSPFELSGGQKRRVALAGILAMDPKILVLDEPMAGLDPHGRGEIIGIIKALQDTGMTIVMVSHSMDDIAELADRIAVLKAGELMMLGTCSEVFSQADTLIQSGLDVPHATRIAQALRERGVPIPKDVFRMQELSASILSVWRERHAQ